VNAKLSLSTANPSIGGSVPELGEQLLKFKRVHIARKSKAMSFGITQYASLNYRGEMYDPTIEDSYGAEDLE